MDNTYDARVRFEQFSWGFHAKHHWCRLMQQQQHSRPEPWAAAALRPAVLQQLQQLIPLASRPFSHPLLLPLSLPSLPKVLSAHLSTIFSPELLPEGASRPRRRLPGLQLPIPAGAAALNRQEWLALVKNLPDRDLPESFGLPANIERAAQQAQGASVLSALRCIGVGREGAGGLDVAQWGARLGPLLKLWEQLMSVSPPAVRAATRQQSLRTRAAASRAAAAAAAAGAGGGVGGGVANQGGPVETFVALERSHSAAVVGVVGTALATLGRALEGLDPVTPSVQVRAVMGGGCDGWGLQWVEQRG